MYKSYKKEVFRLDIKKMPIAVIDSGVGGISVLRELIKIMPKERFLYFGDSKNAPYGTKSKSEVLDLTRENMKELQKRGIKALVIACNTATSAAVRILRQENPDFVIVGIEPAVKPAAYCQESPRVLVLATPLTLQEEKFKALVLRFSHKGEFIPLPCPGLVELIEKGDTESPEIYSYLESILAPYRSQRIDALVLGCTHYPHIKKAISSFFPKTTLIFDGGEGTARHTRRLLEEKGLVDDEGDGDVEICNSSEDGSLIEICKALLNKK